MNASVTPIETPTLDARRQQAAALGGETSREAAEALMAMLSDEDQLVRWQAADALVQLAARLQQRRLVGWSALAGRAAPFHFEALVELAGQFLGQADVDGRSGMVDVLGQWGRTAATPCLVQRLEEDPAPVVRAAAARALGTLRDGAALDALISSLADPSPWVRSSAAEALGAIGDPRAANALRKTLEALREPEQPDDQGNADAAPGEQTRHVALFQAALVTALGHMPTAGARSLLTRYLEHPDPELRWRAARGLGAIGHAGAVPALQALRDDEHAVFGQTVAAVAEQSAQAIERRERGLLSWLRRTLSATWRWIKRRRRQATGLTHDE